ncbi:MAG TPA: DUF58 domain-containing protein, partial [Flavisolibacter sp.]|nr:DUF58 domain-containing protein [Flavisolibacter sp.]
MLRNLLRYWDNTSFYLHKKVYYAGYVIAALFVLSFFEPVLATLALFCLLAIVILVIVDSILLYQKQGLSAERLLQDRCSNGDVNNVVLLFHNNYPFKITTTVIDELPFQFQERKWKRKLAIAGNDSAEIVYTLTPRERGEYQFGQINVFAEGPLRVVTRRYRLGSEQTVKVYPSYVQMRRYHLLAATNRLQETGLKRM